MAAMVSGCFWSSGRAFFFGLTLSLAKNFSSSSLLTESFLSRSQLLNERRNCDSIWPVRSAGFLAPFDCLSVRSGFFSGATLGASFAACDGKPVANITDVAITVAPHLQISLILTSHYVSLIFARVAEDSLHAPRLSAGVWIPGTDGLSSRKDE